MTDSETVEAIQATISDNESRSVDVKAQCATIRKAAKRWKKERNRSDDEVQKQVLAERIRDASDELEELEAELRQLYIDLSHLKRQLRRELQLQGVDDAFAHYANTDEGKLAAFQDVCENVVGERPSTLSACKRALDGVFVNIFDYVDFVNGEIESLEEYIFDDFTAFRRRCRKRGLYPLERAKI